VKATIQAMQSRIPLRSLVSKWSDQMDPSGSKWIKVDQMIK
jgi:hypothetical protein